MNVTMDEIDVTQATEELLNKIDEFLSEIASVSLVEQSRVLDFALDLRNIVYRKETPSA
jgi:ligand-binding sensor protein